MKNKAPVIIAGLVIGGILVYALTQRAEAAEGYPCPYCDQIFPTYEELVAHVTTEHPGDRLPIKIIWA